MHRWESVLVVYHGPIRKLSAEACRPEYKHVYACGIRRCRRRCRSARRHNGSVRIVIGLPSAEKNEDRWPIFTACGWLCTGIADSMSNACV